jgi:metal-responsive CopG/Arc/MetJ family transcriptional regulator
MSEDNMATRKRINISLHPLELERLDRIAEQYQETRSGMLTRIIQEFPEKKKVK